MSDARKPTLVTYAGVAILSAVAGFAAVYGIARVADNGSPGGFAASAFATARAQTAGPALPPTTFATNPLSQGEMAAFVFRKSPEPLGEFSFLDASGTSRGVKDWAGKVVLLNLWATWCAPCRKEMPALDKLQKELGSDRFEVVALSVDRTGLDGARKFLDSIKIANLKLYADPSTRTGSALKVVGMPTTLLIDAEGREIGRLVGPAEWDSDDARRLIKAHVR